MASIWNTLKKLVRWLTLGIVFLGVAWAALFLISAPDLLETENLFRQSVGSEVVILARDGSVLSRKGGAGQIAIRHLPAHLPQAVIALYKVVARLHNSWPKTFGLRQSAPLSENLRNSCWPSGWKHVCRNEKF